MLGLIIPKGTHILVGDGSKALLLVNEGTVPEPDFKVEHVFSQKNPPTREQGTDRPGRAFSSAGYRRAAMADTDWHVLRNVILPEMSPPLWGNFRLKQTSRNSSSWPLPKHLPN